MKTKIAKQYYEAIKKIPKPIPFKTKDTQPIEIPTWTEPEKEMRCSLVGRYYFNDMQKLNRAKAEFCYRNFEKFRKIKILDIRAVAQKMVTHLKSILDLKKTAYCMVCDANQQRLFLHQHAKIVFETEFCH